MRERVPFEPSTQSAAAVRRHVLAATGAEALDADRIALMASELASNAILHAGTPYRVTACRRDGVVRVEVEDGSPQLPRVQPWSLTSPSGRGLQLVARLASRWGVEECEDGKVVWFELDLASPDPS